MRLSDYDLLQLTEEELLDLPEEVLRRLSVKLLYDLKEARERLRIPAQSCHLFQTNAATHSISKLPLIPVNVATLW